MAIKQPARYATQKGKNKRESNQCALKHNNVRLCIVMGYLKGRLPQRFCATSEGLLLFCGIFGEYSLIQRHAIWHVISAIGIGSILGLQQEIAGYKDGSYQTTMT